ncbi:hypothetical protein C6A87_000650 [Mycobacterium sp. ITM-2016-00317]|uniref:hypothetical protein n=1 Tax=Mycobacterium sp. ITM-2016-00317 TaxID=2099694 RepID=UPI00287FAEB3|nr:hypothetical protein [Mycobacterium sp. ITM-2016-00317]WNG87836.1 hypothetical protein C6A87_000650 [Mycobacterium sp. ITM-2016-00317]
MTTGGTPPPLSVDPEALSAAGNALSSSAEQLPEAPDPFMPVGADPLSAAIIGQIPAIETPIMTQLPFIKAQATTTAENVVNAAQAYAATDARNGANITQQMQNVPEAPATGSGGAGPASAVGGAGSAGQTMSSPMQMVGQMAQMPMQAMGAVAAVPQGVMQGAQQAGQQVQQMVGQFSQGDGEHTGTVDGAPISEGAAAAEPDAERAPEATEKSDEGDERHGRHRAAEQDDRIDL